MRIETEGLVIELRDEPECVTILWSGRATLRDPSATLGPFFDPVLERVAAEELRVEIDLVSLSYFNSSAILFLVELVKALRDAQVRTRVVFASGPRHHRMTYEALRQLERRDELVEIDVRKT